MEHLSLLVIYIGSKYLTISSARLGDKLTVNSNQASAPMDRRGQVDTKSPLGSRESGNNMSVDFRWNAENEIGMNP